MKVRLILLAILSASFSAIGGEQSATLELFGLNTPANTIKVNGWGGCKPAERRPKGGQAYLEIATPEPAKQWCGASIAFKNGDAQDGLSKELLEKGFLIFKVNGGNDEFDRPAGGQNVQISIGQNPAKSGSIVALSSYLDGNAIDNDPESWQEARIPLKNLIGGASIQRIDSLKIQYIGTPSPAPILIRDIRLEFGK